MVVREFIYGEARARKNITLSYCYYCKRKFNDKDVVISTAKHKKRYHKSCYDGSHH